jgi:hypothetical protein
MNGDEPAATAAVVTAGNLTDEGCEEVYLRFGILPKGGRSWNFLEGFTEDGVAVFAGRKVSGGYSFDVPTELECAGQITGVVDLMLCRRALYLASGTVVGKGSDNEPLLEDVTLKPVPLYARVELPHWLGEAGKRFSELWCKRRRNSGGHHSRELEEAAAQVMVQSARVLYELYGDLYDEWYSPEEFEAAALEKARHDLQKRRRGWGR